MYKAYNPWDSVTSPAAVMELLTAADLADVTVEPPLLAATRCRARRTSGTSCSVPATVPRSTPSRLLAGALSGSGWLSRCAPGRWPAFGLTSCWASAADRRSGGVVAR